VEIETMSSSESYRVRFGETVPHSELEGIDASVLFGDLVSEFARQLAIKLDLHAAIDFDEDAGDLTISGIVSTRSAAMAMSMASYGYSVTPVVDTANFSSLPSGPGYLYEEELEPPDEDDFDDESESDDFECTCMVCTRARAREADEALAREAEEAVENDRTARLSSMREVILNTSAPNPWQPVGQYARALQHMLEIGMRLPPAGPTTDQQYAEPESERAISESDENHWRTRGV
jgi:hypothetical protein